MQKTGRAYKTGQTVMEIPHNVFATFKKWNRVPFKDDRSIDKRFVFALLLALTEEEKLLVDDIPVDVMEFVYGNFFSINFKHKFYFICRLFQNC